MTRARDIKRTAAAAGEALLAAFGYGAVAGRPFAPRKHKRGRARRSATPIGSV
jgi:hypothetical protein